MFAEREGKVLKIWSIHKQSEKKNRYTGMPGWGMSPGSGRNHRKHRNDERKVKKYRWQKKCQEYLAGIPDGERTQ